MHRPSPCEGFGETVALEKPRLHTITTSDLLRAGMQEQKALLHAPANQKGREKAAPRTEPTASADSVHTAVVPFHTSAKLAVPKRSALSSCPRGMSISSVEPRTATRLRAPGGSPPDLTKI